MGFGQIQAPSGSSVLNNFDAVAAPTVNDDVADGYSQGSVWFDNSVSPKEIYMCIDTTLGAAVWIKTTLTIDELGTMAVQDKDDVDITGGTIAGVAMDPTSVVMPIVSVVSAAGTTNLDATKSNALYLLTGSTTQTFKLPVLPDLGTRFRVKNLSTGALTIESAVDEVAQLLAAQKDTLVGTGLPSAVTDGIAVDNGFMLTFPVATELLGWSIYYNHANNPTSTLKIQYSDDGLAWDLASDWINWGTDPGWNSISWASVGSHLHWRIVVKATGDSYGISEMKVTTDSGEVAGSSLPDFAVAGTGFAQIGVVGALLDDAASLTMNKGDAFEFEYVSANVWAVRY